MNRRLSCSIDEIDTVTPAEAKEIIDADKQGEVVLLDVRQPEEYEADHIPGAKLIPLGELEARHGELDRDSVLITYCRSGRRSLGASILLCGLGFRNVYNIGGGILYWDRERVSGPAEEGLGLLAEVIEPKDALLLALQLEKGTLDFYARYAHALTDSSETVSRLIDMENQHLHWVHQELANHWQGPLPDLHDLVQMDSEDMEAGISVNEAVMRYGPEPGDEMEVIEAALEIECKAYDLYKRMRDAVNDPNLKDVFQKLSVAERGHIHDLSEELKTIVSAE